MQVEYPTRYKTLGLWKAVYGAFATQLKDPSYFRRRILLPISRFLSHRDMNKGTKGIEKEPNPLSSTDAWVWENDASGLRL